MSIKLNKVWPSIKLNEVRPSIELNEVRASIKLSEVQSKFGQQEPSRSPDPSDWDSRGTSKVT